MIGADLVVDATGAGRGGPEAALAPVRARYASWLGLDRQAVLADRDEDPSQIRALQLVLRLERDDPPDWYTAVELAAHACAALCCDERTAPGGPWFEPMSDYCQGHIRKVTRRARGSHWDATADLDGITVARGATQVRALVPGLVSHLDKRVSRLQVGGTDVERVEPAAWAEPDPAALVIHPAPTVAMTLGKTMAQAGHAGMIAAALMAGEYARAGGSSDLASLTVWRDAGLPVAARPVTVAQWHGLVAAVADPAAAWRDRRLLAVRDAGFTEIDPGTVTVIARAPRHTA